MMTEEEAKQKWCFQLPDQCDKCIASKCMAWRWFYAHSSAQSYNEGREGHHGYCGLAGKVE